MEHAQSVRAGAWLLILLNLLMALGAIWVLARMTPAIEEILSRNGQSLEACEEMFAVLAEAPADPAGGAGFRDNFRQALLRAEANVTEKEEPQALEVIRRNYPAAFLGNGAAREATVAAIRLLAASNRRAMIEAEARARHLGTAGAWGVVFMALTVFVVGLLFKRALYRNLVAPLEEVDNVLAARRNGDRMRRCNTIDMPRDVRRVLGDINDVLDQPP